MPNVQSAARNDFDSEVLQSELPVIVDFWADWCAPCRRVSPILEELADDYAGRVRIAKVNVDEEVEITERYAIRSMPTFLFIRDGEVIDQISGARPREDFEAHLEDLIDRQ